MKVTFAHTGRGQVTRDMDHVPRSGESITLNGETWIADGVAWMLDGEPEALVLLKTKQEYMSAFRRGLAGAERKWSDPWRAAAQSVIEHGLVAPADLDLPVHLAQHPACAIGGKRETVFTRCCGAVIELGRPMWACEIPADVGLSPDCCERPWVVYGDPA